VKILYIWDADYPWDVRVEKICSTLIRNGNEVHLLARNLKKLPEYENIDGVHVHRLKSIKNNKLNYALSFPAFISPIWKHFLDKIIHKHKIELIIVRDLPMAITAIWAGKRHRIPVILDMAEDYLAMIWDIWKSYKFRGINLLVRNPYLTQIVEQYVFKRMDYILVVVEEAINVIERGGGVPSKVTIVSNTPSLTQLDVSIDEMNDDLKLLHRRYSAIYTGGIQLGRGIQVVLDAIPEIIKSIPEFLFVVVGDGYASEQLKKIVRGKRLQDYVLWVGWVDHRRIFDYIRASKIGLIPHFVSAHVNTTIPNKIFDYMALGLPVVASDAVPLKRILNEEQCGITFKSGDVNDLARSIISIYGSHLDYGKNAINAVRKKYNWAEDEKRLFEVIGKFS
jgi:glycosyltransferase involved in cell wall biosynthesis